MKAASETAVGDLLSILRTALRPHPTKEEQADAEAAAPSAGSTPVRTSSAPAAGG